MARGVGQNRKINKWGDVYLAAESSLAGIRFFIRKKFTRK